MSAQPTIPADIAALLEGRRFKVEIAPPEITTVYSLSGCVVATPGNLVAITAAIKVGKSAVIGALIAAPMAERPDVDTLGFSSSNPHNYALVHFDTEQCPADHWHLVNRALKRAGRIEPPDWFYSYCLTGMDVKQARDCIQAAVELAHAKHGGIHGILIDGIADLVHHVNDDEESNAFVAMLQAVAIHFNCPIVGVIHFNPGSDKPRGHLGSQFERKAETNLRLDKKGGTTTIWSDKQRREPIPRGSGPSFAWSDEADMHITVIKTLGADEDAEKDDLTSLANDVFGEEASMRYCELADAIKSKLKASAKTAERRITRMRHLGIIHQSTKGLYARAT